MINIQKVKYYCNGDITQIENYELAINDNTQTWNCHHRKETDEGLSVKQLVEQNLYFHRPSNELIFLTSSEHNSLHHKGKHPSEEQKQKQSELMKGKPKSEEHKRNISEAKKGKHNSEQHNKNISESLKGENNPMYGKISPNKNKHRVYHEDGTYHYEK